MKIYLTGPLTTDRVGGLQEMVLYDQMEEALSKIPKPIKRKSPLEFRADGTISGKYYLQERLNMMLSCDLVVTMDHIDLDPISKIEVSVARQAEMQVVPYWKFIQDAKQA